MTAGLGIDRLLDFFFSILYLLKFWVVVDEFERVVVLTLGKRRLWWLHRWVLRRKASTLGPGIHPILPFKLEVLMTDNVVPCSMPDLVINMTLKDHTPLHVQFSVMWQVIDMAKFQLEVEDADAALVNIQGMVQEYLFQFTWDELMKLREEGIGDRKKGLPNKLKNHCNRDTRKWGAELADFFIQSFIVPELKKGVIKAL